MNECHTTIKYKNKKKNTQKPTEFKSSFVPYHAPLSFTRCLKAGTAGLGDHRWHRGAPMGRMPQTAMHIVPGDVGGAKAFDIHLMNAKSLWL